MGADLHQAETVKAAGGVENHMAHTRRGAGEVFFIHGPAMNPVLLWRA